MMHFAYLRPDGVIHSTGACPDGTVLPEIGDLTPVTFEVPLAPGQWQMVGGTLQTYAEPPPPAPTLEEAKAARWDLMKQARAAMEFGPFAWDGSTFDGDQASQQRIQGASQLATLATAAGQPFSIDWTLADNTVRTLSATDMIGVGMAMGEQIATAYGIGRALRAQIEAATTIDQVESVQWPT